MSDLATLQPVEAGIPLSSTQLRARLAVIQDVMRHVMQADVDYGVIPGTQKPTLFKPGAEKLCVTFRLAADTPIVEAVPEYTGDIRYRVQVPIRASDGTVLAVGLGECSTGEEKYRWRRPMHIREYEAAPEDQRREKFQRDGSVWQQVRVHPADVANTVLKMAHKRAYVHGVIMATAAGAIFTQDIEDQPDGMQANGPESGRASAPPAQPQRREAAKPPAGAGATVTIRVKDITKKEGTNAQGAWTKWTIVAMDGQKYGTFNPEIHRLAEEARATNTPLEITFTQGQYGRDIQDVTVPGQPATREPGSDDQ